ncbi:hypothetical protein P3T36_004999 [Kitasatospora sp. MAP12-15]|uniref:hypothetical protein n=1 Tax=unclassified Kitasatospora TaxID=2633591 RepID=UPI0024751999|nr:hypothetical protein [Kitasatospora sp. MAP12-44]MDH6112024.1 hypothetical protein [Kitasatospora sp. MAP12-44]
MFALAVAVTALLLLEVLPSAVVALPRARVGLARLDELTRLGVLEGRKLWVVSLLGVCHSLAAVGVLVGLSRPSVGVAGAALELAVFLWVLSRQLRFGDRGRALFAYSLFSAMALAVLVVDALR